MNSPQLPLSNLQLELLKIYAAGVPDEYLPELKQTIARFLFEKARDRADEIWEQKGYTQDTMDEWLNEE